MRLWVHDIKFNPLYSLKNKELVERILDRQFKVLQHRSSKTYDFFQDVKGEVDDWIKKEDVDLSEVELFEQRILKVVDFNKKRQELAKTLKSYPELYEKNDQDSLIYDETKALHQPSLTLREKVSLMF